MTAIWQHFKRTNADSPNATCNVCKSEVSRGGSKRSKYNTTNLIKHLKSHHPQEYAAFCQATEAASDKLKQPTLSDTLQRKDKLPKDSERYRKITELLAECIAVDNQPISIVEDTGIRRLLNYLEPRYDVPSRHYMSEKALPALSTKVREHVQRMIKEATSIALTTDLWSSDVAPMSLLSLTAHWIDSGFTLHQLVLHASELRGSHTAERIQHAIEDMLAKWGIEKDRVHVILRDNAANMKKAMEKMGVRSLGCLAHTFQLVVLHGLLSQRSIIDALANARKLVGHFKHSPKAYSVLEDIQLEVNMPIKRLQQDVQTRWNSSQYMMQSLLEQKRPLSVYAADHNLPGMPTTNQWVLMQKAVGVLSPFEELTRAVSSESACASDVIPAITVLKRHLSREDSADSGVKTMKSELLAAVTERFDHVERETIYSIATLLDARYKERFFSDPGSLQMAKEALITEVGIMEEKRKAAIEEPARKEPRRSRSQSSPGASSSFVSLFEEILEESVAESRPVSTSSAVAQVESYLAEPTIPRSDNPLHYWKAHAITRPALADTAIKFLGSPCTSVDSERLFSAVSLILDEQRNRMSAEMVQMLVCIKKNIHYTRSEKK